MIQTQDLTYMYSPGTPFQKVAVDHINLEIEAGELVGIIGHTGSGKSTLIQHLNGLLRPTSGRVLIDGTDIWKDKQTTVATRFQVGLVFQYPEYQLFEDTVEADIAFGPKNMKLPPEEVEKRVKETARLVGLREETLKKSPFELSGGQKRRVAIAGVMAMAPRVLILDEPTAGLDPKGRDRILGLVQEYHQETGSTVLLVSHSMEDVAKFATRILVMNQAKVFCYDEPPAVFRRSEEISGMGLAVPQITRVFNTLKQKGYPIAEDVYTVEYARRKFLSYLESRGKGGQNPC